MMLIIWPNSSQATIKNLNLISRQSVMQLSDSFMDQLPLVGKQMLISTYPIRYIIIPTVYILSFFPQEWLNSVTVWHHQHKIVVGHWFVIGFCTINNDRYISTYVLNNDKYIHTYVQVQKYEFTMYTYHIHVNIIC